MGKQEGIGPVLEMWVSIFDDFNQFLLYVHQIESTQTIPVDTLIDLHVL